VPGEPVNTVVETVAAEAAVLDGAAVIDHTMAANHTGAVTDGPGTAALSTDAAVSADATIITDAPASADVVEPGEADDAGEDPEESGDDPDAADPNGINFAASGEPPEVAARPMHVTETLTASALMPEIAFAPEVPVPEARQASAVWDAADAVTEIYRSHYNQLVRLSVLLVHDVQTAEEVVQEAFEAMHQAWKRLRDSEKALQYLRQTVVNKSRSVLRHRKVVDMHAPKPAPDEPSAEHAALAILERSAVAAALRSLPERQREAIALRYYADFSEADIAQAMGISRGAVKSHTARAMAALKSILTQETP